MSYADRLDKLAKAARGRWERNCSLTARAEVRAGASDGGYGDVALPPDSERYRLLSEEARREAEALEAGAAALRELAVCAKHGIERSRCGCAER